MYPVRQRMELILHFHTFTKAINGDLEKVRVFIDPLADLATCQLFDIP